MWWEVVYVFFRYMWLGKGLANMSVFFGYWLRLVGIDTNFVKSCLGYELRWKEMRGERKYREKVSIGS